MRQSVAVRALSGLSGDFTAAWDARNTIEGPRSHIARDTVRDVQYGGAAPRKALLLNGFVLDAVDLDGANA